MARRNLELLLVAQESRPYWKPRLKAASDVTRLKLRMCGVVFCGVFLLHFVNVPRKQWSNGENEVRDVLVE